LPPNENEKNSRSKLLGKTDLKFRKAKIEAWEDSSDESGDDKAPDNKAAKVKALLEKMEKKQHQ
jgi:hypothetical protein